MRKISRLEMMRAQRQQREDEVTRPYQVELNRASNVASALRRTLRTIEEALGREIAEHLVARIADGLRDVLMRAIYEAAAKTRNRPEDPILLTLEPELLRFMDPKSIENRVLREYTSRQLPTLSLRVDQSPSEFSAVAVEIRIPQMGYRQLIANF